MFLINDDDIYRWLHFNLDESYYTFSDFENDFDLDFIKNNIEILTLDNNKIINSNITLNFGSLNDSYMKELPIKFGTINGHFQINKSNLESFKGFPDIVNGNLVIINANFKGDLKWDVKYVEGYINLCGENCELKNLDFLEKTKFNRFDIKQIKNSVFENNNSIEETILYKDINLIYTNWFRMDELNKIISWGLKDKEVEYDDYFNSFDNKLEKEID